MDERDWMAEEFERWRPHLRAVAYRMLGSRSEAEDAVQESWVRLDRAGGGDVVNLRGWLTAVVGRVCLDMLRARRARRERDVGGWLPGSVVTLEEGNDPAQEAELADSVGLALLVVLETLSPPERLAFVLHDMFAVPFEDIAEVLARTPAAARQLASRARRRVQGAAPRRDAELGVQRRVVDAFLAASRAGDFEGLLAVLDPNVVFRLDIGAIGPRLARRPAREVVGAAAVAREVLSRGAPFAPMARPAVVDGRAGLVVGPAEGPYAVFACDVSDGRITAMDLMADPARIRRVVGR